MSTHIKSERSSPNSSGRSRHGSQDFDSLSHNFNEDERNDRKRSYELLSIKDEVDGNSNHSSDYNQRKYVLSLDFPTSWKYWQIKEYIEKEYQAVSKMEMLKDNFDGVVKLRFSSMAECTKAKNAFEGKVVKGVRLSPSISVDEEDPDYGPPSKTKKENSFVPWRPDIDVWEEDPTGLYGFKPEFLQSLGIKPPLQKWVHVDNIKCGKMELKGLMDLAGEVVKCMVESRGERFGKVMFSHPIEAVQAIMILNGQQYNKLFLKITMCQPVPDIVPKGLQGLGTGLGLNGEPLKDVVRHYERYAKGRSHSVNTAFFRNPEELCSFSPENLLGNSQNSSSQSKATFKTSTPFQHMPSQFNQGQNLSTVPTQRFPQPVTATSMTNQTPQMAQGPNMVPTGFPMMPVVPNFTPMGGSVPSMVPNPMFAGPGAVGPQNNPIFAGPRAVGPQNNPMFTGPGAVGPQQNPVFAGTGAVAPQNNPMFAGPGAVGPQNNPKFAIAGPAGPNLGGQLVPMQNSKTQAPQNCNSVEISNLPLNTTFATISQKMAEVGQVINLQLTSPGCAVVKFANRTQAEKCCQQYNNFCVMGNMLKTRFV